MLCIGDIDAFSGGRDCSKLYMHTGRSANHFLQTVWYRELFHWMLVGPVKVLIHYQAMLYGSGLLVGRSFPKRALFNEKKVMK